MATTPMTAQVQLPSVNLGDTNFEDGFAGPGLLLETSYEMLKGFRVGFNGYWLEQLTDHQIDDEDVPNSKELTVGLGPGVQFGGDGLWFRVNSYIETDVRNRPEGIRVTFRSPFHSANGEGITL